MKSLSAQKIEQLQRMLATAQKASQSGMHAQAEALYRDVLKLAPEAWDVRQQFAMLLARTGRAGEAARQFRLIVQGNPTHAASHANLATALAESDQLEEAIKAFRRALALNPAMLGARIAHAETLRRAKRYPAAIDEFKTVLSQDKLNGAAFNGLGLVYRDMEDLPRALECFEHAVGIASKNPEYRMNFGSALQRYELYSLAVEQFYEAVTLKPDWLEAVVLLGESLQKQRRYDEARECFERAQQIQPDEPELAERIGYVYLDMGDAEQALTEFGSILLQHPERIMAKLGSGRAHMEAGNSAQASAIFEALVAEFPGNASGYSNLAVSRKFSSEDALIPTLKALAEQTPDNASAAVALNFALGKIYDDCKEWDQAWQHYASGNRLRNARYDYQAAEQEDRFDRLMAAFSREFIDEHCHLGVPDDLPVFIVGMPRSGTTLTEQIISSHPQVIGAGEVFFWGSANQAVPYTLQTRVPYPDCMGLMTQGHARDIADRYAALLRKIAGPTTVSAHITDKMPHNFVNLGLIALLFPNAPIIHCKRDALDNCLSIFFQNFGGEHPYAYDLANLGHHHRQYQRLMAHWHEVLPGRILDINYEDTIVDPEYWSRRLIDHVGLEWDDACLAPHKQERTVKTASHWQVRQPIYKTSVQRWKHYEKYLGPLKETLGCN